jgi:hypothetical protein
MYKHLCTALIVGLTMSLTACFDDDERRATPPDITGPASLANAIAGTAIPPVTITATGTTPITFGVIGGSLPPGLFLDVTTGQYTGTPTTMGVFNFTVVATNRAGSASQAYTHTILQLPDITGPATPLAASLAGTASAATNFTASGSTPITWSVTAGALPPGMVLDAATGAYTGTPSATGSFTFTVTATNGAGSDSSPYTQQVNAPALNAQALIGGNRLVAFASTFPAGLEAPTAITGINAGETLVSIDRRPQNGFLYGLGFNDVAGTVQLYSISPTSGVATPIGTTGSFVGADGVTPTPVGAGAGTRFGIDFNPTVDRVRVVNSAGQNFRMNPNNGAFVDGNATVANLNMDGGINGPTTTVQETAYTNSAPSATATTQYTLDASTDALCIQNPPNAGTQTACQGLGVNADAVLGFDIDPAVTVSAANAPATGAGVAALRLAGQTGDVIASVDLANGMAGAPSPIMSDGVLGLALQTPAAVPFVGLSADGTQLLRFTSASPGTAVTVTITGVVGGEALSGIDYRPQTGQLYALGVNDTANNATLYLLDPQTGVATPVGAPGQVAFVDAAGMPVDLPPASSGYGFDFNPTVDRVRVVSNSGLNFRVNPNNGAPVDGNLNNTAAPPAGTNTDGSINALPVGSTGVSGAAYTNSFGQPLTGGVTTQYVLDSVSDQLYIQNPPNSGTITAGLGIKVNNSLIDFTAVNGLDIPSDVRVMTSNTPASSGSAFAALMIGGTQKLFSIDLVTGASVDMGALAMPLSGLAVGQVALR